MLANPELICESSQLTRLEELLPHWREVPIYRQALTVAAGDGISRFQQLPLLAKRAMRENFPNNFLPAGRSFDLLLEQNLVEREHTSGTSEERLPVIFPRG